VVKITLVIISDIIT